jgi:hypothetical protein
MTDQQRQPDELGRLIAQVCELEQAGVFKRTPVNVDSLAAGDPAERPRRLTHRLFVGMQVAACVALVIGVAAVWRAGMPTTGPTGMANSSGADLISGTSVVPQMVHQCLTGPTGGPLSADCQSADFDRDGDVDLEDYGVYQRAFSQVR